MNPRAARIARAAGIVSAAAVVVGLVVTFGEPTHADCLQAYAEIPCELARSMAAMGEEPACEPGSRIVAVVQWPQGMRRADGGTAWPEGVELLDRPRRCRGRAVPRRSARVRVDASLDHRPQCIVGHVALDVSEAGDWSSVREWEDWACCAGPKRCRCVTPPCKQVPGIGPAGREPWRRERSR